MKHTFKTLGMLSDEQKKDIWKNKISGSQIKRIVTEPDIVWQEKKGVIEPFNPGINPIIADKMWMGNFQEDNIIKMAMVKYGLDIKIDKDTFQSDDYPLRTANIDGYIGTDINNIDYIIECKNTTTENVAELVERYKYQLKYYTSFFNAKKGGIFLFLVNGWQLIKYELPANIQDMEEIENILLDFEEAMLMDMMPEPIEEEKVEVESIGEEHQLTEKIKLLLEAKDQISIWSETEQRLKEEILLYKDGKFKINSDFGNLNKIEATKGGRVDYKALAYSLMDRLNMDYIQVEEAFKSPSEKYYQLRTTNPKGGK